MPTTSDRLRTWRSDMGFTQAELGRDVSDVIGESFGQSVIANYETRGVPATWRFLEGLAERYSPWAIDMNWLLGGSTRRSPEPAVRPRSKAVQGSGQAVVTQMANLPFQHPTHFLLPDEISKDHLDTYIRSLDVSLRLISRRMQEDW